MNSQIKCSTADCSAEDLIEGFFTTDYLEQNGWGSLTVRLVAPGGEEARQIWFCAGCCLQMPVRLAGGRTAVPQETQPERIDCAEETCKSVFHRPQDAAGELSTADVAQLHGWTLIDREKGLLHCAWGHTE